MKEKVINIKSGVDIDSIEFKNYYAHIKDIGSKTIFLDMAVSDNSKVLSSPVAFDEKDYRQINVDDMAFIWEDNKIIGHVMINIKKDRFVVPLSAGTTNHLDKSLLEKDGGMTFIKLEQILTENIDINNLLYLYMMDRVHGKMEKTGTVEYEKTFTK